MLDDEINKRIREAADQYHPAYDDKAWEKMQQTLDEHLPQKKDGKRVVYFLLLIVIICAGLLLMFYPEKKDLLSPTASNTIVKDKPVNSNTDTGSSFNEKLPEAGVNNSYNKITTAIDEDDNTKQKKSNASAGIISNTNNTNGISLEKNVQHTVVRNESAGNSNINIGSALSETAAKNSPDKKREAAELIDSNITVVPVQDSSLNSLIKNNEDTTESKKEKSDNPKPSKSANKQSRSKKSFANNFGISVSAGPDVSGVSISEMGKVTIAYGAGVSYDLSRRLTLRTGFYFSKKIYAAGKSDYHSGSVNYNYLEWIDADCKVYEIPLIVDYNFGKIKNHSWFASAGLSSYLMKKEDYVYYYKYPSGNTYDKSWSVSNQNKHYFSVLDLSAGYQYTLNKKISLAAEPYLRLPLSGVGAGKIKLNSGGILFTIKMKPFTK